MMASADVFPQVKDSGPLERSVGSTNAPGEPSGDILNLDDFMDILRVQCKTCGTMFVSKEEFLAHLDRDCRGCSSPHLSETAQNVRDSGTHQTKGRLSLSPGSNEGHANRFLCGACSKTFETSEECHSHMEKHHEYERRNGHGRLQEPAEVFGSEERNPTITMTRCPVRGCQYRFGESGLSHHLLCHMDTTAKDEFRCPHCRQTFSSWRRCAMHLWTEHKINVDLLECPECKSYRTVVTAKMQRHLKLHHNPEKIFSCATCGRGFTSLSLLRDHCLAHFETGADATPRWYAKKQCKICLKFFADSKSLKKHVQAIHSKLRPYICHVCNHQSSRKAMLEMHMRQHTGEKPYECNTCDYKTGDHNSLRRHKMGHTGQKQYQCPLCDYASIQSYAFKKHVARKHANERDSLVFSCKTCNFSTVNQETFVAHVNQHKMEGDSLDHGKKNKELAGMHEDRSCGQNLSRSDLSHADEAISSVAIQDASRNFSRPCPPLEEEDSLHAAMDFGGTTIPAS